MPADFVLTYFTDGAPREYALERDRTLVGRARECDLCFPYNTEVSRLHATLVETPDGWSVEDVSSRSGTFLNGDRVEGRRPLRDGDCLRIGCVELVFRRKQHDAATVEIEPGAAAAEFDEPPASPGRVSEADYSQASTIPASAAVGKPGAPTTETTGTASASHYALVGVPEFEQNLDRIQTAGAERIRELRASGEARDEEIDAVSQALACLTHPERKRAYDRDLAEGRGLDVQIRGGRAIPVARPGGAQVLAGAAVLVGLVVLVWGVAATLGGSLTDFLTEVLSGLQRALTG